MPGNFRMNYIHFRELKASKSNNNNYYHKLPFRFPGQLCLHLRIINICKHFQLCLSQTFITEISSRAVPTVSKDCILELAASKHLHLWNVLPLLQKYAFPGLTLSKCFQGNMPPNTSLEDNVL